jgi:uroporphyrinogen decarboxylase
MDKKQMVLDAFDNKPVERIPVGFWFHFTREDEWHEGIRNPDIIRKNIEGHRKFFKEFQPDFVKLMSDGYFEYPSDILLNVKHATELKGMQPLGPDHPWIKGQVELVRALTDEFGSEVATFYNTFSPVFLFKFQFSMDDRNEIVADLILQDKEAVKHALDVIGEDLATLAEKVIKEGRADGIYLSVQNIQDERVTSELYREVIAPSELKVLERANKANDYNILHICGYEGSRNDLDLYVDYHAKAVNWAVTIEKVSLEEGKKFFGGRAVMGGFDNRPSGILYSGTQEEIESFTEKLVTSAGKTGVILGADCTVPADIDLKRLSWVRDTASTL